MHLFGKSMRCDLVICSPFEWFIASLIITLVAFFVFFVLMGPNDDS